MWVKTLTCFRISHLCFVWHHLGCCWELVESFSLKTWGHLAGNLELNPFWESLIAWQLLVNKTSHCLNLALGHSHWENLTRVGVSYECCDYSDKSCTEMAMKTKKTTVSLYWKVLYWTLRNFQLPWWTTYQTGLQFDGPSHQLDCNFHSAQSATQGILLWFDLIWPNPIWLIHIWSR